MTAEEILATHGPTACFTGHRPDVLGGYDETAAKNLMVKAFLKDALSRMVSDGYRSFICGGALGVDMWAADAALAVTRDEWLLGESLVKVVMALPYADYGGNWPEESRNRLAGQCREASAVHIVCEGEYASWKNHERNKWMVDHSSLVCAVWNGSGDGGTASCVRYAFGKKVPFIRLNPETGLEEPVTHVPKRSKP